MLIKLNVGLVGQLQISARITAAGKPPAFGEVKMRKSLRQRALEAPSVFGFVVKHQRPDYRRGCSGARELARLWWRVRTCTRSVRTKKGP